MSVIGHNNPPPDEPEPVRGWKKAYVYMPIEHVKIQIEMLNTFKKYFERFKQRQRTCEVSGKRTSIFEGQTKMNQAATLIATAGLIYLGVVAMDRLAREQQQREPS